MWVIQWSLPWVSFWTSLCGNKRAAYICQIIIFSRKSTTSMHPKAILLHHAHQTIFKNRMVMAAPPTDFSACFCRRPSNRGGWKNQDMRKIDKARIDTSLVGVNINGWASEILTNNRKPQYFFCEQTVVSRWFSQINDPNEKSQNHQNLFAYYLHHVHSFYIYVLVYSWMEVQKSQMCHFFCQNWLRLGYRTTKSTASLEATFRAWG